MQYLPLTNGLKMTPANSIRDLAQILDAISMYLNCIKKPDSTLQFESVGCLQFDLFCRSQKQITSQGHPLDLDWEVCANNGR